jgi:hypothetical protein
VTVRELIKVLTLFPPDHEVLLEDWSERRNAPAPCNLVVHTNYVYGGKKIENAVILDNAGVDQDLDLD